MIIKNIPFFSLAQIADSGQCFRLSPLPDGGWATVSQGRFLKIFQEEQRVTFCCTEEEFSYWQDYFDLETDYEKIAASVSPSDRYLAEAARFGRGIRILRQDPWEMIVTFIISQQKTIPKIKEAVELLSSHYGKKIPTDGGIFFSFPSPQELCQASLEDLKALKLGYRAKYIHRICQEAAEGILDLEKLKSMDYDQSMDYLTGFYGIGEKVANCICLFGLHHINAFPIDTWIKKILLKEYYDPKYGRLPKTKVYEAMVQDHFGSYKGYAGVMQQYIFFYERNHSASASVDTEPAVRV